MIPTYERVKETVRAVQSVLRQTVLPQHVVVADDGSSETTFRRLSEALTPLPVELVRAPRSAHPGRTRNAGLDVLNTEWIAFLDSDDTWAPAKLERQLSAKGVGVAICTNARRVVSDAAIGTVFSSLPRKLTLSDLISENKVINSSVLIRRDVLDEVGKVASSYLVRGCEDYATWLRVATMHEWIGLDEPLVDYVDEPSVSIRGSEEFSVHPGQQAAWLDYVIWRRDRRTPLRLTEMVLSRMVPRLLNMEAHGRSRRGHSRGPRRGR